MPDAPGPVEPSANPSAPDGAATPAAATPAPATPPAATPAPATPPAATQHTAGQPTANHPAGPAQHQLTPLDPPMLPFVLIGMAIWLVLGLVGLAFRATLAAQGHERWLTICLAGFLIGIPGLLIMGIHDSRRRRRRARASQASATAARHMA